jgi:GNAT superfamily N-acetyltransferase
MHGITIKFDSGDLPTDIQEAVTSGFTRHSSELAAPRFNKERLNWQAFNEEQRLLGVATADLLWDWLYIDELWVDESARGTGLGRKLMEAVEAHAQKNGLIGIWLWTQSWQAEGFYHALGYQEFTRFNNFPRGHCRIGFRKILAT